VDPSETPAQAALRELTEETGLVCAPDRLIPLGASFPEASTLQARVALFVALDCELGPRTDQTEIGLGECVSFSMDDAQRLLLDHSLEDVTTALCLHRFFQMKLSK
jgi:ADP-ribose pyrophosphatase